MSAEIPPATEKFEPSYEFSAEYVHELCAEFLSARDDGFGPDQESYPGADYKCFLISGKSKFSDLGRYVEATVFGHEHTFKNSPETMRNQYGEYENHSTFLISVHGPTQMPVAVMRLIENSDQGLKTFNDLADPEITGLQEPVLLEQICHEYNIEDLDKCIDIATLAMMENDVPKSEARIMLLKMYRTLFLTVINNSAYTHMVNISTTKLYGSLRRYNFPFVPITEPFSYLDETEDKRNFSIAIIAHNEDFQPELNRYKNIYRARARRIGEKALALQDSIQTDSTEQSKVGSDSLRNQAGMLQLRAYVMGALVAKTISRRNYLDRGITQEVKDIAHNNLPLCSTP